MNIFISNSEHGDGITAVGCVYFFFFMTMFHQIIGLSLSCLPSKINSLKNKIFSSMSYDITIIFMIFYKSMLYKIDFIFLSKFKITPQIRTFHQ